MVRTRSLYEVLRNAAASLEVPEKHARRQLAMPMPEPVEDGRLIRVRSSTSRPSSAVVSVKHRDHWFYIDATDHTSRFSASRRQRERTDPATPRYANGDSS